MSITKISPSVVDFDDSITISTTDNSDNLTLTSTDADASVGPAINLYRNSGTPADNDFLGNIKFNGRNDNSQDVQYAEVEAYILDASDGTEDGLYNINVMTAGTNTSYMQLKAGSGVVFNEDSNDIDFRVESDVNTHSLFVDGETGKVALGTSTIGNGQLIINTADENHIRMENGSELGQIYLEDGGDVVVFAHGASQNIKFLNGTGTGTERVRIGDNGILFNGDTAAANALDDYEEGTYNPTWTGSTGTGSQSYSYQNGWYVKVGSLVTCFFDMNVTSSSGMSGAGYISLPIASKNQNWYAPIVPWEVSSSFTDSDQKAGGYVQPSAAVVVAYKYESENSVLESSGYFNINVTGRISGQVTYQAA